MKISPFSRNVKEILQTGFYKIPRFQRPYSWERENVEDLWRDVLDRTGPLFIGSMVAFRGDSSSDVFQVVDGQQRLTTITLFLAAIRNALRSLDPTLADAVQGFIERKDSDGKSAFILSPESSHPYFQEWIQNNGSAELPHKSPRPEEQALQSAFEHISGNVQGQLDAIDGDRGGHRNQTKKKIDLLRSIRDKILALLVIFIELDSEDDAYIIFETLNTRGKDLQISDLVKNHLFKLAKPKTVDVDAPKILWSRIGDTFHASKEDINVNTFIHHFWLSKYDYTTEKEVFRRLKRTVSSQSSALAFLKNLSSESEIYRAIYEPDFRKWSSEEAVLARSLRALMVFRVRQQMPMVLAILRKYTEGLLTLRVAREVLRSIEAFHFQFTAITSQRSSGGISLMYASAARAVSAAEDRNTCARAAKEIVRKLRERLPTSEEFDIGFGELAFSNNYTARKPLVQYTLEEIYRRCVTGVEIDFKGMSIEHLASQKGGTTVDEGAIASIGNLILVPPKLNSDVLRNQSFSKKKEILGKHNCWLDSNIEASSEWGAKQIKRRTVTLAKFARTDIWSI